MKIAEYLHQHPKIIAVYYPGLESHPQHGLAARQMRSFGGLLTFDLRGDIEAGCRFTEAVRLARQAPSLGGPETLISHPASTTHVGLTPEEMVSTGIGPGTMRVSCGLEYPDDVVADIEQALVAASG